MVKPGYCSFKGERRSRETSDEFPKTGVLENSLLSRRLRNIGHRVLGNARGERSSRARKASSSRLARSANIARITQAPATQATLRKSSLLCEGTFAAM